MRSVRKRLLFLACLLSSASATAEVCGQCKNEASTKFDQIYSRYILDTSRTGLTELQACQEAKDYAAMLIEFDLARLKVDLEPCAWPSMMFIDSDVGFTACNCDYDAGTDRWSCPMTASRYIRCCSELAPDTNRRAK